jgi:hypothetical protein
MLIFIYHDSEYEALSSLQLEEAQNYAKVEA